MFVCKIIDKWKCKIQKNQIDWCEIWICETCDDDLNMFWWWNLKFAWYCFVINVKINANSKLKQ